VTVLILPSGRRSRPRDPQLRRPAGDRRPTRIVGIVLDDEIDISITYDRPRRQSPAVLKAVVTVCWLDERPLDRNRKYLLRHTTREVRARIDHVEPLESPRSCASRRRQRS
jgi:sulfate adenylyltransferase subunit 1